MAANLDPPLAGVRPLSPPVDSVETLSETLVEVGKGLRALAVRSLDSLGTGQNGADPGTARSNASPVGSRAAGASRRA